MMWSRDSAPGIIDVVPENTGFSICIEALDMPSVGGFSLTVSPFCRPRPDMAVTEAKAGALYANNARIMADARKRGFSNALSLDVEGFVAETASTNVFMVRDGVVFTPVPNGMFLNGITRQRVIGLLRADGVEVVETSLTLEDFDTADEIFVTGNIAKVMPVRALQGPRHGRAPDGVARARLCIGIMRCREERLSRRLRRSGSRGLRGFAPLGSLRDHSPQDIFARMKREECRDGSATYNARGRDSRSPAGRRCCARSSGPVPVPGAGQVGGARGFMPV